MEGNGEEYKRGASQQRNVTHSAMGVGAQNNLGGHQIFAQKICHCN